MDNEIRAQYAGMEEEAAKNSLLPAILWRNSVDTAKIFCVNGDYLADISAVGILDAMMGETYDYDIYPVINAQNLVIADLPTFVSENEEEMQKRYSQSAQAVYQGNCVAVADLHCLPDGGKDDLHDDAAVYVYG